MSGRTSVVLSDGRRVRGYRKTLRQNARPKSRADLEFVFKLLPSWAAFVSPGAYRNGTISVAADGTITARHPDTGYLFSLTAGFLRDISAGTTIEPIPAKLFRPARRRPDPRAPMIPASTANYEITINEAEPVVVIARAHRRAHKA